MNQDQDNRDLFLELDVGEGKFNFNATIASEIENAEGDLDELIVSLAENEETIKLLTPDCDKLDYALAASSGVICGIMDIFLVSSPDDSVFGKVSDKWFEDRTKDFASLCGWKDNGNIKSAIKYLENTFPVPYDQTGMKESGLKYLGLDMKNHHFKSLAHSPSLMGLYFSILDQFGDQQSSLAHFVSAGDLAIWKVPESGFELRGKTVPAKLFSAFVNWFGHLISDMSGSSKGKGRGMGIPSPLWTWTNDIIAIKKVLKIDVIDFDKVMNELALNIYLEGYDLRFQAAQAIPVFVNEMLVRTLYSLRRMIQYFINLKVNPFSFDSLWKHCEPFSNATVKRMLTVAHGTFCLLDLSDAAIHGVVKGAGSFNIKEFFLRLNVVGIGRFIISLYGEGKRGIRLIKVSKETNEIKKEKNILEDYLEGLYILSDSYNDQNLLTFADDLKQCDLYVQAFSKSVVLAELRSVPEEKILRTKADIDSYFNGGKTGG